MKKITLNPATCNCKNGTYLGSITDDSVITCGEIIEEIKTLPTNFNEKKTTCKTQNLYILLAIFTNYHSIIDSC